MYNNWTNDLLGTNVYKTLGVLLIIIASVLQWTNTTSVISKLGTFSSFLSLVILLLVPPSDFIVSGVKRLR